MKLLGQPDNVAELSRVVSLWLIPLQFSFALQLPMTSKFGCYYVIGVPLGIWLGWGFHQGVKGVWSGMIFGGTVVQTVNRLSLQCVATGRHSRISNRYPWELKVYHIICRCSNVLASSSSPTIDGAI